MFERLKGKKFYRSPRDGVIFGICSGLALYLDIDVIFIRLIVLGLLFLSHGWPVLVAYALAVFIVPIDPAQDTVSSVQTPKDVTPAAVQHMDHDQNM